MLEWKTIYQTAGAKVDHFENGPYSLVRIEDEFGNSALISVRDLCGIVLAATGVSEG